MEAYALNNTIELTVPAEQSMMLVVRMTVAGVMSRAGFTLDAADDIKMAVEEACNCLMLQSVPCASLSLCFRCTSEGMRLSVKGVGRRDAIREIEADACDMEIIRCILESMVDEVTLDKDESGLRAIEMFKRLPVQGGPA